MKIRLTKVQVYPELSEETTCFTANVLISGVWRGRVKNDGRGGANDYWPATLRDTLQGYAATLPPVDWEGLPIQPDADWIICEQLEKQTA
jgi:hypothetical protein